METKITQPFRVELKDLCGVWEGQTLHYDSKTRTEWKNVKLSFKAINSRQGQINGYGVGATPAFTESLTKPQPASGSLFSKETATDPPFLFLGNIDLSTSQVVVLKHYLYKFDTPIKYEGHISFLQNPPSFKMTLIGQSSSGQLSRMGNLTPN